MIRWSYKEEEVKMANKTYDEAHLRYDSSVEDNKKRLAQEKKDLELAIYYQEQEDDLNRYLEQQASEEEV